MKKVTILSTILIFLICAQLFSNLPIQREKTGITSQNMTIKIMNAHSPLHLYCILHYKTNRNRRYNRQWRLKLLQSTISPRYPKKRGIISLNKLPIRRELMYILDKTVQVWVELLELTAVLFSVHRTQLILRRLRTTITITITAALLIIAITQIKTAFRSSKTQSSTIYNKRRMPPPRLVLYQAT